MCLRAKMYWKTENFYAKFVTSWLIIDLILAWMIWNPLSFN